MIFFGLLSYLSIIIAWQSALAKKNDTDLGIVAFILGGVIGYALRNKYISIKIGKVLIRSFIILAILIIVYGIIHRPGMASLLPWVMMIASLVPMYLAFMSKLFIKV